MNVFGVGLPEMALILVLALLVFGPKKLPEIGKSLAQALGSFKKAQQEFETEFKKEAEQLQKTINEPMKASIEPAQPKALSPLPEEDATLSEAEIAVEADGEAPVDIAEDSAVEDSAVEDSQPV